VFSRFNFSISIWLGALFGGAKPTKAPPWRRDCLHRNSSVGVTEFILLVSEHLSNRIVSDVKQSPYWASIVHETTNIAAMCYPFHLPEPGQREDFQLCVVLKPSNETGCLM